MSVGISVKSGPVRLVLVGMYYICIVWYSLLITYTHEQTHE